MTQPCVPSRLRHSVVFFGTGDEGYAQYMTAFERNFSTDSTDSFASDDADCDADSCDSTEDDF